jgi:uncharacterized membrane protein YadS
VVNSALPLGHMVRDVGNGASRFLLICAIAALGLKTRFSDIAAAGWKPVALMVMQTAFIAGVALAAIEAGWV